MMQLDKYVYCLRLHNGVKNFAQLYKSSVRALGLSSNEWKLSWDTRKQDKVYL